MNNKRAKFLRRMAQEMAGQDNKVEVLPNGMKVNIGWKGVYNKLKRDYANDALPCSRVPVINS